MSSMSNAQVAGEEAAQRQILSFQLGRETYGVDILRVKEIRGWSPVTKIPHSPPQVLGVLNLRGAVVPIIDLRLQFALDKAEFSPLTVIIVLSLHTPNGTRECGVVVDGVSDVVDIEPGSVKSAPQLTHGAGSSEFISGIATVDDRMLILLNVDDLVAKDLVQTSNADLGAAA